MINRRNLRVKALQTIYAYEAEGKQPTPTEVAKALQTKYQQTGNLFTYLVTLTVNTAKYVEVYSNQKASKHLPTTADLNINTKLAGNDVLWQLQENKTYDQAISNGNITAQVNTELVKELFSTLLTTPEYQHYTTTQARTTPDDVAILQYIFNQLILQNEDIVHTITDLYNNFDDDIDMLIEIVNNTLNKAKHTQFTKLVTPDKNDFTNLLINTYFSKHQHILNTISPKLKNWDADRVAKLDMIILNLGVSEFLYFNTIPTKVTLNEYIDIAKAYSTPQSGQFVNGILDSLLKDLEKSNTLHKTDYKKTLFPT